MGSASAEGEVSSAFEESCEESSEEPVGSLPEVGSASEVRVGVADEPRSSFTGASSFPSRAPVSPPSP